MLGISSQASQEYFVKTSVPGVNIYRTDGKNIGLTPLLVTHEMVKDQIDGYFLTLLLTKEGYNDRIVMFDTRESVSLNVDMYFDKDLKTGQYDIMLEKNKLLKAQIEQLEMKLGQQSSTMQEQNKLILELRRDLIAESMKDQKSSKLHQTKGLEKTHHTRGRDVKKKKLTRSIASISKAFTASSQNNVSIKKHNSLMRKYQKLRDSQNELTQKILEVQYLILSQKYQQAKKELYSLEQKYGHIASLYTMLAYVEMKTHDYKMAKKFLNKSLSLNKKDKTALRMMEMIEYDK